MASTPSLLIDPNDPAWIKKHLRAELKFSGAVSGKNRTGDSRPQKASPQQTRAAAAPSGQKIGDPQ